MCCRFVFVLLLMCVADSEARVDNNFGQCSQYFYKGKMPEGLTETIKPTRYKYICQHYENDDHFATLYMPDHRIPLYSAYLLDEKTRSPEDCKKFKGRKKTNWFIEPQLNNWKETSMIDDYCQQNTQENQASNEDYRNTNFDRGHLNPSSYQCDAQLKDSKVKFGRTATYTLTNAVPQDPHFNQHQWKVMEQIAKEVMLDKCNSEDSKMFFVTGVIPSGISIPSHEHDYEGNQRMQYHRVNVPSYMWTAACCDSGETGSFSFSYYGRNGPYSYIMVMPISRLLHLLRLNGSTDQIFVKNCFEGNGKSKTALDMLEKIAKNINAKSHVKMYIDLMFIYEHSYLH